jgi:thiamine-monophosphate kinase
MRTESDIIERISKGMARRASRHKPNWLAVGIGDDAAVLRRGSSAQDHSADHLVLSCDAFLENVHFLAGVHSPDAIGYKALARATSDLAAMGAVPRFFMLSLALPASRTGAWLDGLIKGIARAAREFGMMLIGGDTSQNPTVIMNLTVGGDAADGHTLTRSGARPGDGIYVSGTLGAAQLGLELVLRGLHRNARSKRLLDQHLRPKIHIELGRWLAGERRGRPIASAATDTSDGLSTDLTHICQSSGVNARIYATQIPVVKVPKDLQRLGLDSFDLALHGGEDYQLLFTVPAAYELRIPKIFRGTQITKIGEILRAKSSRNKGRIELVDAERKKTLLKPSGWDSFRTTSRNNTKSNRVSARQADQHASLSVPASNKPAR